MIISLLGQKGGTCKSTIARGLAVQLINKGVTVHIADLDSSQQTSYDWALTREAIDIKPEVDVAVYKNAASALKAAGRADYLIIDGAAYASTDSIIAANGSDLVIIPSGVTKDDLRPSMLLANDLAIKSTIERNRIIFALTKVPDNGELEVKSSKESIESIGYQVIPHFMPYKSSYGKAMDVGYSMTESRFTSLNEKADLMLNDILSRVQ